MTVRCSFFSSNFAQKVLFSVTRAGIHQVSLNKQRSEWLQYCVGSRWIFENLYVVFSLWCSCDADASPQTGRCFSHKMLLAQQLEVHKVLKVQLHLKKKKRILASHGCITPSNWVMKGRERWFFFLSVYVSKWVWEEEKEVILLWEPGSLKVENCSHWFPFGNRCKNISSVRSVVGGIKSNLETLSPQNNSEWSIWNWIELLWYLSDISFSLCLHLTRFWQSWSSVSAFTTFIFSCWKRAWKVLMRFLYTFSIHASMFHRTLKRNSNLYYSITTQTGQPPKLLFIRFWAWNDVWLAELCCPSFRSSLIPAAVQIFDLDCWIVLSHLYDWRSVLNSDIRMTQVCFYQFSPNGQMGWCICIPNSQNCWLIDFLEDSVMVSERGR